MRAAFFTLGCKVNQYETQLMRESLIKIGYDIVDCEDNPDVLVINSCTVTAESDRKTRQSVRHFRKLLPGAVIVLTGCMPQAFSQAAGSLEAADIVLGNATNERLPDCLKRFFANRERIVEIAPHDKSYVGNTVTNFYERTKAFLKIEDGCDRYCSYCIIPTARGRVRSKPLESITSEVQALADKGYREVVLIGINLSAYGKGEGLGLADAVEAAAAVDGIKRIRLGSMEPDQFTDSVIDRLSKVDKLCAQFHLSLQSGCDNTLKRMNRHYDTAFYEKLIRRLREKFSNCSITTDVMVGFAGETDEDFTQSLEFVQKIGFARTHVFAYSRRRGTVADKMDGQISNAVKHERSSRMIQAADLCQQEFLKTQIGGVYPVLFENRTKNGYYEGYTPNYTLVRAKCDNNPCGMIINTRLTEVCEDGCIGVTE